MAKQTVAKNYELRKIEDFKDADEDFKKNKWNRRNYMLPDHEKTQTRSQQLQVWRTNRRSLGNIRASGSQGLNRPGLRSSNCAHQWKTMGRKVKQKCSMRENWIWKSEHCERVKVDEAAMQVTVIGAASIRPPARQQFVIFQCERNKVFDGQYQPATATTVHQVHSFCDTKLWSGKCGVGECSE